MADINFKQSAEQIVELIGGKGNILQMSHCVTRLRFSLKNNELAEANKDALKNVKGVLQIIEAGGQFQVVIGPKVGEMFAAVQEITGQTGETFSTDTGKSEKAKPTDIIMKLVSGIMMPVVGPLAGCGLVACLVTLLQITNLIDADGGTYQVLYGIGQACLYFFPILVGCSTAKYFGMDTYLGGVIGAAMIYPDFVSAAGEGATTTFLGVIPLTFTNYTSTVFPAIVAVWFGSVLNKFFKKHIPSMIRFAVVPFLTIVITVPVSLLVIGPVINAVSSVLSQITLMIYNFSPLLCGIILGGSWLLFIVPLGLHWGFMAIFMNNLATLGYEPLMGLLCGILSLSGTLLAVGLKSKNSETRSIAFSAAITNFFGVSEPGLYGIVLQHKETIITSFIGGAVAGILPAVFHTYLYAMGAAGIFAMPGYINPDGSMESLIGAVLCNVVGFVLCFLLTWFWKFDPDKQAG